MESSSAEIAIVVAIIAACGTIIAAGIQAKSQRATIVGGVVLLVSLIFLARQLRSSAPPPPPEGLAIESLPVKVFNYEGIKNAQVGAGSSRLTLIFDTEHRMSYWIDYSLPSMGDGWAGLSFTFADAQNLSDYTFIEVIMEFGDEQANTRLFVQDGTGQKASVLLGLGGTPPTSMSRSAYGKDVVFVISLDDATFKYINRRIITEIDFDSDATHTRGNHSFAVKRIRFLKSPPKGGT